MAQTLGQLLLNDVLPPAHRTTETLKSSALKKKLTAIAKEDPVGYVEVVRKLKHLGDELATLEGISVGLEDIAPLYESRDKIMKPAIEAFKHAKNDEEKEDIILKAQSGLLEHTQNHPGTMGMMARSGSRGDISQLMKTVASPVAAVDMKGKIQPWLISKSYAEGLSPADDWVAAGESRLNTIRSSFAVSEPGDASKMLINTLYPMVVTKDDCGTRNGLALAGSDPHILGRFLATPVASHPANTLVTPAVAADLRHLDHVTVRSPMTCELVDGVCRKCQGLDENGRLHQIGVNLGVRAAQALTEPLTQFALNAKHGVRLLKGAPKKLEGFTGFKQLLEMPKSFFNKAVLAEKRGVVTKVDKAAHGGHYIHVDDVEHYAGPTLTPKVGVGDKVDAGDMLTDGIPKPDELVHHKGLGVGRKYLVDSLHEIYKDQGLDIDRRHLELLARADLGHVKVTGSDHPKFVKGEVVPYAQFRAAAAEETRNVPLEQAEGHVLGKELYHFTVGTPLTKSIVATLHQHGVTSVPISTSAPKVEFVMKPLSRVPLLNPDWLARMSHRYLKDSLLKGIHFGESSDTHSTHPIPAYAYAKEFGQGTEGKY